MYAIYGFYLCSVPYAIPIEVMELEETREVERVARRTSILDLIVLCIDYTDIWCSWCICMGQQDQPMHRKALASALTCCSA
jgi:hypothetical protein